MFKLYKSHSTKILHVLLQVARDRKASQERVLKTTVYIKYIQDCQYLQERRGNLGLQQKKPKQLSYLGG